MIEKEKKVPSCRVCGADMPPKTKICPSCGAKNKKPVYKRPWFIIVVVIVALGVIGSFGDPASTPEADTAAGNPVATNSAVTADKPKDSETAKKSAEPKDSETAKKSAVTTQEAISMDQSIYGIVFASATQTSQLGQTQGGGDLLATYNAAKADKDAQLSLYSSISSIKSDKKNKKYGDALTDYTSSAQDYIVSAQAYARDLMKYIDKQEMKYLSSAQDDLKWMQDNTVSVQAARIAFLMKFGLTSDQIGQVMSGK